MWFEGFWWWVCPSGQPTSSQQFALWNVTREGIGTVIPGSVATSGELTAGQWNWVPLSAPVQLAIGTSYNACTGFTGGFPNTNDQFGADGPFAAGIVNGSLSAYSDADGSLPPPTACRRARSGRREPIRRPTWPPWARIRPTSGWMSKSVASPRPDTAARTGCGRTSTMPAPATSGDSAVNYLVATEVHLNQACTLDKIWYYSPHASRSSPPSAGCGTSSPRSWSRRTNPPRGRASRRAAGSRAPSPA